MESANCVTIPRSTALTCGDHKKKDDEKVAIISLGWLGMPLALSLMSCGYVGWV